MRIAMLSYHTCPLATLGGKSTGGMNVYVRELTRALGAAGVQVDVFTRSQDEHVPHVLHDLGYGNRIVHVPAGPETPLPKAELAAYLPQFLDGVQAFAVAKNLRYDLLHSHYWMSGLAALTLKADWNIPLVHMYHTLGVMKQRISSRPPETEDEQRLAGEQEILRRAERIIAATPAELTQLKWLYKADERKITVIPPGVDTSRFYPIPIDEAKEFIGVRPCDDVLLFVGRIEPLKGIAVLLEALAILRRQEVKVCLAIIGGDPDQNQEGEMARLQALCKQYGLEDMVAFLGKRSQDTLPYYYSAALAVVMPSQYESFGMVALEAMACGTPVVASQVGGLAYLVQDGVTGYTIPVDEPDLLAERLAALVRDPDLRQRMGLAGAALACDYSWDSIAARIIQVYRQL
ncbi:MAG: glycosyltransferase [Chloroflexi bacterium]|nr:glycosyltransferase [Chloroflexota bacterium]